MARRGDELFNPVTRTRVVFVEVPADNEGRTLTVDWYVPPGETLPGAPHYHAGRIGEIAETFTILSGTAMIKIAGRRLTVSSPDTIEVRCNDVHTHPANAANTELHIRQTGTREQPEPDQLHPVGRSPSRHYKGVNIGRRSGVNFARRLTQCRQQFRQAACAHAPPPSSLGRRPLWTNLASAAAERHAPDIIASENPIIVGRLARAPTAVSTHHVTKHILAEPQAIGITTQTRLFAQLCEEVRQEREAVKATEQAVWGRAGVVHEPE